MVVRDLPPRPAPEPLDPISVWVVGGGVNKPQVVMQLGQHLAYQLRPCGRMRAQVIDDDDRHAPASPRAGDRSPHLGAKDIRGAAWSQPAVKPPVAPVDQSEAIDFVVGPWSFDEALSASAFATPDAREGWMKGQMDFILEIDIGVGQEGPQGFQVWRHFLEHIGLDQRSHGWRSGRAGPG